MDIFLSHSSADDAAADTIKAWLRRDRASWSVFLDKNPRDGILAGQGWQDRLRSELQSCRLVLAIITKDWLASRWCFTEAVTANFRGKDFVGVLPAALPDGALDIAPPIVHERQRQPLDLATGAGWDDLLHALDRSGLDPNQWFAIPEGVGPYPGFVAFEEKDAGIFFGRDHEITAYLDALNRLEAPGRAQALVISGGSGTGKSSLLKAGLIPRLRRRPDWLIIPPFDPSREPVHAFLAALRQAGVASGAELSLPAEPPPTVGELTDHLQDALRAIEDKAQAWLLLPLDQSEVLLAGAKDGAETEGSRLLTAIGQLLANRRRKLVAVFTIRTEFMPALERDLPPAVRFRDLSLRPISALAEIIEKPAARFGIELEPGLTGRMVEDTRGADALPLLAYTLRELNEKYGADKLLTNDEYRLLGGVKGAIEQKLRDAFSDPRPTDQELTAFRRFFVRRLVLVDESAVEGQRYLRRSVAREALPKEASRLVGRLGLALLLVDGDDGTVSLAHERLIEDWEGLPLRDWLAADSSDRRLIESLKSRLSDHQQGGPFLTEKPLRDAEDLLARDPAVEADEPDLANFIENSLRHERELADQERERQRQEVERAQKLAETERLRAEEQVQASHRNRRLAYIAGVLALISAGIGYLAFDRMQAAQEERDQAFRNESQLLAEQARKELAEGFPVIAMRLALAGLPDKPEESGARPWVGETAGALVEAMGAQRELKILRGHEGRVLAAAFSPDGARIVSGGDDQTVRVWDAARGEELLVLHGHEGPVWAAAFSPDGARIVSGGGQTVRVWDAASGKELLVLRGHEGSVRVAAFSPDVARIVSVYDDDTVRVGDVSSGKELLLFRGPEGPINAGFAPDGARIVSASGSSFGEADNRVRVWDAASGRELLVLRGHENQVNAIGFAPDGARIVSASGSPIGGSDDSVRVWDARSGGELFVLRGHDGPVNAVAFSSDGARIVSGSGSNLAHVFGGDPGNRVRVWDATSGGELFFLRGHEGPVNAVAFSTDGARIVSGSDDRTMRVWDAASTRKVPFWPVGTTSPDGSRIVELSLEFGNRVSAVGSGQRGFVLGGGEPLIGPVAFSSDSARIVGGCFSGTVRVWDATSGREVLVLRGHEGPVGAVAFSPDGVRIVSGSGDTVRVWDAISGKELLVSRGHEGPVDAVAISPSGARIMSGSGSAGDHTVRVWDATSGKELLVLRGQQSEVAEFSPDGARVLSVSADNMVGMWDVSSGQELLAPRGQEVYAAAFSPDGARIVSASADDTVRVWDAATGQELFVLRGQEDWFRAATFPISDVRIASGSEDKTVRLAWVPRSKQELIETARTRLPPRALTEEENRRFNLTTR